MEVQGKNFSKSLVISYSKKHEPALPMLNYPILIQQNSPVPSKSLLRNIEIDVTGSAKAAFQRPIGVLSPSREKQRKGLRFNYVKYQSLRFDVIMGWSFHIT